MPSDGGSVDIDGFKLRYQFEGSGLPTIVIGSTVEHPRTFSSNLRHLQLIFVDHPGLYDIAGRCRSSLGRSDDDRRRYRVGTQALGLTRFAIAGHSGNAYMALEYRKVSGPCRT
jgi:proline iminopeptidase